ncbi:hypothetical protein R50072_23130 [Simiduia litorea]|uniref:SAM-dependent methyltransferase n=1 Tax=Simiduia litorea TaxID=1435348 RepID=UPI0036F25FD6
MTKPCPITSTDLPSADRLPKPQLDIINYYVEAGMDYEPWSRNYNMHFGYYRWGLNPFKLEAMLEQMNQEVLQRLQLNTEHKNHLIDLGCGVGSCARYCVENLTNTHVTGISIVPHQVEQAKARSANSRQRQQLDFQLMDYRRQRVPSNHFDGAYAIESSCYDKGKSKLAFLTEAYRTLKPSARLVVADGFTKTKQASGLFRYCYRKVCDGWALEDFANIDDFVAAMQDLGFEDIVVEDAAWRVAPSIGFVPWISMKYFFNKIFRKTGDKRIQWGHFLAPMYGIILGLHRKRYSYYLVSAKK